MRLILTIVLSFALIVPMIGPAAAKPPLREVSEIDDSLMMIAIADEIRKKCDGISARMIRALSKANGLKSRARALGYSDKEIKDYTGQDSEKARMRAKAEAYLKNQGVEAGNKAQLCAFGKEQIRQKSEIGALLR
ncbi:MAG: DUF5333 domain-containing protein [Pelagimonas sp.]|jgi:hypothetical protein|nr:DUF5333 domain-containing protein [Pelagimonas sp.]